MSIEAEQALENYEQAKKHPLIGLMERLQFSELDAGLKNPYSGTYLKARHDGALELYAHGESPVLMRANPEKGSISTFAPEAINLISRQINLFAEENGLTINRRALNYDILDEEKAVFLTDEAIQALELLLNQGVVGAPAPGQRPVSTSQNRVSGHHLFKKSEKAPVWDEIEKAALNALGLEKVAGIVD